ncbi:MAG: RibD family protein, partial [Acidimicrobiales bacterium]
GRGVAALRSAGIEVDVGVRAEMIAQELGPYLHHRSTGRPFVVLKLAASLDGRIAAPDRSSKWITGQADRQFAHRLRAESDAVLVGAATVRADDPELTVRDWRPAEGVVAQGLDPKRLVVGTEPAGARIHPCEELSGSPAQILDDLGADGVLQLLLEGGAGVAGQFHAAGLIDRYELLFAPMLFGGSRAVPMFAGDGAQNIASVWRGRIEQVGMIGHDIHVTLLPPVPDGTEL